MKVHELIELLRTYPQDLPVAYSCCSEQVLMEADQIEIQNLCEARPDGWIQNERPDKPTTQYVLLPGN